MFYVWQRMVIKFSALLTKQPDKRIFVYFYNKILFPLFNGPGLLKQKSFEVRRRLGVKLVLKPNVSLL